MTGSLTEMFGVNGPDYDVSLKLSGGDGLMTITGTAGTKQVSGRAYYKRQYGPCDPTGSNYFTVFGALTVSG